MDDMSKKLIQELIDHLEGAQADDLKGLVEKSKAPVIPSDGDARVEMAMGDSEAGESPAEEAAESPAMEASEPKEGDEQEMSDDELADLLKKYVH